MWRRSRFSIAIFQYFTVNIWRKNANKRMYHFLFIGHSMCMCLCVCSNLIFYLQETNNIIEIVVELYDINCIEISANFSTIIVETENKATNCRKLQRRFNLFSGEWHAISSENPSICHSTKTRKYESQKIWLEPHSFCNLHLYISVESFLCDWHNRKSNAKIMEKLLN